MAVAGVGAVLHARRVARDGAWGRGGGGRVGCLACLVRRRRLALVVVAPAGDAAVFPKTAGVVPSGGNRCELHAFRRLGARGSEHPFQSARIVVLIFCSLGDANYLRCPLKVVTPTDRSPVLVQRAGMVPPGRYVGERPVFRREKLTEVLSPTENTAAHMHSTHVVVPCADCDQVLTSRQRRFALGVTDCPTVRAQSADIEVSNGELHNSFCAEGRKVANRIPTVCAPIQPYPARHEYSCRYCRETFVLRRKGWRESLPMPLRKVCRWFVEFIAPAGSGPVRAQAASVGRSGRNGGETFIRRRAQLTADVAPPTDDAPVGLQRARMLESCAHLRVPGIVDRAHWRGLGFGARAHLRGLGSGGRADLRGLAAGTAYLGLALTP